MLLALTRLPMGEDGRAGITPPPPGRAHDRP